jgi:hypothetical protein
MAFLFTDPQFDFYDFDASLRTTIKGIHVFTANVDPSSLTTVTDEDVSVTRAGIKVGDVVVGFPPASLEAGLTYDGCRVASADAFLVRIGNPTAGTIDGADLTWTFMWFQLS